MHLLALESLDSQMRQVPPVKSTSAGFMSLYLVQPWWVRRDPFYFRRPTQNHPKAAIQDPKMTQLDIYGRCNV